MKFKSMIKTVFAVSLLLATSQQQAGIFSNLINTCKNINFSPITQRVNFLYSKPAALFGLVSSKFNNLYKPTINENQYKKNITLTRIKEHHELLERRKEAKRFESKLLERRKETNHLKAKEVFEKIVHCQYGAPCISGDICPSLTDRTCAETMIYDDTIFGIPEDEFPVDFTTREFLGIFEDCLQSAICKLKQNGLDDKQIEKKLPILNNKLFKREKKDLIKRATKPIKE